VRDEDGYYGRRVIRVYVDRKQKMKE